MEVNRRIVTLPVSGSTSTSAMAPENDPPTPRGFTVPRPTTGPPVSPNRPASSRNVIDWSPDLYTPRSHVTVDASTFQSFAARSCICRTISCAASYAAHPVANVVRLPPVTAVYPIESVSTTVGRTSSAAIPRTSAACIAMDVRVPPISVDPSTRFTVPSAFTLIVQLDSNPTLNQNPTATPRPRFGPPSGDL